MLSSESHPAGVVFLPPAGSWDARVAPCWCRSLLRLYHLLGTAHGWAPSTVHQEIHKQWRLVQGHRMSQEDHEAGVSAEQDRGWREFPATWRPWKRRNWARGVCHEKNQLCGVHTRQRPLLCQGPGAGLKQQCRTAQVVLERQGDVASGGVGSAHTGPGNPGEQLLIFPKGPEQ